MLWPRHLVTCLLALAALGCQSEPDDRLGAIADFQLTERSGQPVSKDDLRGKVWVAGFFFTRCSGPCPKLMGVLAELQHETVSQADVRLVSITADPDHDTPAVLTAYAEKWQADPQRWLFLTGPRDKVYALIQDSFKLGVQQNEGQDRKPGEEVLHSTRLVVVDRKGEKRGYYDGTDPASVDQLKKRVARLVREKD
ncbi:MAG: SCO family protein [Planctomycetia bacterium]|nr:SCO family protein [Planctomycetia bacterium]